MEESERESISEFINETIKKYRIRESLVLAIPIIGQSLHMLFFGGDSKEILKRIEQESDETQAEIINAITKLSSTKYEKSEAILVVGSGNAEDISICTEPVVTGTKQKVEKEHKYGGSALNYSMRLLNTGNDVYPVLTIGNDRIGKEIRSNLEEIAANRADPIGTKQFIRSNNFLNPNIKTPSATVVSSEGERTIFSQEPGNVSGFDLYLKQRIKDMLHCCYSLHPSAVMIGHIYSDAPVEDKNTFAPSTVYLLDKFKDNSLIYTNFGGSQIKHGINKWEEHLHKIDIFQLNIIEAKRLFKNDKSINSLKDIILWFQERGLSTVVTLDKFGAVAVHKKETELIVALPIIGRNKVKDTTGAGDAFASGMVTKLKGKKSFSFSEFKEAIGEARLWAAECCTHYGASSECPSLQDLEIFKEKIEVEKGAKIKPPETLSIIRADDILTLVDLAYS